MTLIPLSQGQSAFVDEADAELIGKYKWHALYKPHGKCFYAGGYVNGKAIRMHNFLMQPPTGFYVDHINRNTLDNRRSNLRVVTHAQNCLNRVRPTKSGAAGIHKSNNRYTVLSIGIIPRRYLGTAATLDEGIAMQKAAGCVHSQ